MKKQKSETIVDKMMFGESKRKEDKEHGWINVERRSLF